MNHMPLLKNSTEMFMVKVFLSGGAVLVAGIPLWIYLLADAVLKPAGFWQNLVLAGIGLWFLGAIQLFLLVGLVLALVVIWHRWC